MGTLTTVIHIKNAPTGWEQNPEYVYIGRKRQGLKGTFGNPFRLDNEKDRVLILSRYRNWFERIINRDIEFLEAIWTLQGKTLVCYCKPKACHGDVIAEFLNAT